MKILSIDGGGIRGIIPATALCCPPASDVEWDMIAGTSTGGIIALCLAAGVDPNVIRDLYIEQGHKVFKRSFFRRSLGRGR